MKKETSNTWSDGLVMDLNPLNTPSTVLTDNLNGTIITYNGNEHSLQNDQGNFKLRHCRLSPNYIPVGVKEYADILYIVSYNPIDETTEIGSYPSPLVINTGEVNSKEDEINRPYAIKSMIDNVGKDENGFAEFSFYDLDQYGYNVIFAEENLKMNPGDEYKLIREFYNNVPMYEGIEYEIIDEDKKPHPVSDLIERDLQWFEYKNVPWDVPGWLCFKSRIADFDSFSMGLNKFQKVDNTLTLGFVFRFSIDDPILINLYNSDASDDKNEFLKNIQLKFEYEIATSQEKYYIPLDDLKKSIQEWYDGNIIVQYEYEKTIILSSKDLTNKLVSIKATPILIEDSQNYKYRILYDHLSDSIEAPFENFVTIDGNVNLGNEIYQFKRIIDDDGRSTLLLEFDVQLIKADEIPIVGDEIKIYYKLFDINGNAVEERSKQLYVEDIIIDELNSGSPSRNFAKIDLTPDQCEQIYQCIFYVTSKEWEDTASTLDIAISNLQGLTFNKKYLITSTAFNKDEFASYNIFTNIPMNDWVSAYIEKIEEYNSVSVSDIKVEPSKHFSTNDSREKNKTYWDNKGFLQNYSTTVTPTSENVFVGSEYLIGCTVNTGISDWLSEYRIGMWKDVLPSTSKFYISNVYNKTGEFIEDLIEVTSANNSIGNWDVNTAIITDDNEIIFNNHLFESKRIIFNKVREYGALDLNFKVENVTVNSLSIQAVYDTDSRNWDFYYGTGINSDPNSRLPGDTFSDTTDNDNASAWYLPKVFRTNISGIIAFRIRLKTADSAWIGMKTADDKDVITYQDWDKNTITDWVYYIAIKRKNDDYPMLIPVTAGNLQSIKNLFDGCKVVLGNEVHPYVCYLPVIEDGDLSNSILDSMITSKFELNNNWNYNDFDLFNSDSELACFTWSGEKPIYEVSNSIDAPDVDFSIEEEVDAIEDEIDVIFNYIRDMEESTQSLNIDGESSFTGFYANSTDSLLKEIENYTTLSNGQLRWTGTDSQYLAILSASYGNRFYVKIAYTKK